MDFGHHQGLNRWSQKQASAWGGGTETWQRTAVRVDEPLPKPVRDNVSGPLLKKSTDCHIPDQFTSTGSESLRSDNQTGGKGVTTADECVAIG